MKKLVALLTCLMLAAGLVPALAEAAVEIVPGTAYIMYADASWTNQYWLDGKEYPVVVENVLVEGAGDYKVSLSFPGGAAQGLAFMALGIKDGESLFPGMAFTVKEVKVNGEPVALGQPYTSSDDKVETRSNLYNEWVGEVPEDARIASGDMALSTPKAVDPAAFAAVDKVEVSFTVEPATVFNAPAEVAEVPAPTEATAYIMYADESWTAQYWLDGKEYPVTAANATVTGEGDYEVSLEFPADAPAKGIAFTALGIKDGELAFPGYFFNITAIEVNGVAVPFTKPYTSSDDGLEARSNIYNTWVGNLPDDARTPDGDVSTSSPVIVDPAAFVEVQKMVVRFAVEAPKAEAYIMFADSAWSDDHQYWLDGQERPVKATNAMVTGAGDYEVSLQFPEGSPALGTAFTALGIKDGELKFPGYVYEITAVEVNGQPLELARGYTSSDDKVETRSNIFNEWVSELPEDARTADGNLDGCTAKIVDPADFASVETMTVRFTVKKGAKVEKPLVSKINPDGYPAFLMFGDEDWLWQNLKPGTAGDTVVLGDGVYEVYISKDTLPEDKTAVPPKGAYVLCVDITDLGAAMSEIGTKYTSADGDSQVEVAIAVFVDGKRISVKNDRLIYGDIEGNNKLRIEICNAYGTGTWDNCPIDAAEVVQQSELRVVFSLKGTGFNTEAATDLEAYLAAK